MFIEYSWKNGYCDKCKNLDDNGTCSKIRISYSRAYCPTISLCDEFKEKENEIIERT